MEAERGLKAAAVRASIGAVAGAILWVIVIASSMWEPPSDEDPGRFMLRVVAVGGLGGAAFGVIVGAREIRGKAKPAIIWSLAGTVLGTLAGNAIGYAFDPPLGGFRGGSYVVRGIVYGAIGGAILGGILGRARHGGRLTLGEIMVVIAFVAVALSVLGGLRIHGL